MGEGRGENVKRMYLADTRRREVKTSSRARRREQREHPAVVEPWSRFMPGDRCYNTQWESIIGMIDSSVAGGTCERRASKACSQKSLHLQSVEQILHALSSAGTQLLPDVVAMALHAPLR
jgi:hypothetical protein